MQIIFRKSFVCCQKYKKKFIQTLIAIIIISFNFFFDVCSLNQIDVKMLPSFSLAIIYFLSCYSVKLLSRKLNITLKRSTIFLFLTFSNVFFFFVKNFIIILVWNININYDVSYEILFLVLI